jgi:hypothetical protein
MSRKILKEARDLVAAGIMRRRNSDGPSPFGDATRFCVFGALCRVMGPAATNEDRRPIMDALNLTAQKAGHKSIIHANDDDGVDVSDILAMIDDTIERMDP